MTYKEGKKLSLINRRNVKLNYRYPELLEIGKNIGADEAILDGEIIVFDKTGERPDFYRLAEREHVEDELRIKLLSEMMPATYVVFDILRKNGQDLMDKPLLERKKVLEKTVKESERIQLCYYTEKGKKLYQTIKKKKMEGVIGKVKKSLYHPDKRSKLWLKIKRLKSLDCVICGFTSGIGRRKGLLGSLIGGCYHKGKLRYVGKIGTGFSEKELEELTEKLSKIRRKKCPFKKKPDLKLPPERKAIWVEPKYICEARFMSLSKDKIMRAPAFIRLRKDKKLKECILEV